jgi:hypothetical protein
MYSNGAARLPRHDARQQEQTVTYQIEVTDTFGGESNYSWVRRDTIETPAKLGDDAKRIDRYLIRTAKAFAGWTGMRCTVANYGDMIEIRPRGICQVCFVTWSEA